MGIFDRWIKRTDRAASPSPPAPRAGTQGMMVVPDGHQLCIHSMSASPSISSLEGGVWLAHIDGSSDDTEAELDAILAGVEERMRGSRPRVLMSAVSGSLSSLMAPADPAVIPSDGMLVWTVDAASLARAPGASLVIQRWLHCIYAVGTGSTPLAQQVFVHEIASPHGRAVAALAHGLGIGVRVPEAKDAAILAEVHRPEGVILSALLGTALSKDAPADATGREANQAKELAGVDLLRRERLETEERDALNRKLAQAGEGSSPVRRAPRLRALILAVADDGDTARPALYEELLRREIPLQVIVDPQTRGTRLHTWPGGVEALPVFADESSLLTAARDHGMKLGTFAAAVMPPLKLLGWAAEQSWAIAMNAFRTPDDPVYVVCPAEDVKALAQRRKR